MKYVNFFLIYSILGHLFETIIGFFWSGESGILYSLWTPIYGLGVLIILVLYYFFKNKKHPYLWVFLGSSIILSIFEIIGGNVIEQLTNDIMWNYEKFLLSIGKYCSVEIALIWGILGLFLLKFLHPMIQKIEKKLPKWWTIIMVSIFIIDVVWTILTKVVI